MLSFLNKKISAMTFILTAVLFFFVFSALAGLYISVRPPRIVSDNTPRDFGLIYEDVKFKTADGLKLAGWFVPCQKKCDHKKAIIFLHGYPADKGDILPGFTFLAEKYNLFFFDFRYFGQSEGYYSTAGLKETEDLKAAIRYLKSRGVEEVGLWGFSMGGAVALAVTPEEPAVKAVVSYSSYASLDLMAEKTFVVPGLNKVLGYLMVFAGQTLLGVDVRESSPLKAAEKINIPILLIHSKTDQVIPFEHALLLQKALAHNSQAEFIFEDDLFHGQLGNYRSVIEGFFSKSL